MQTAKVTLKLPHPNARTGAESPKRPPGVPKESTGEYVHKYKPALYRKTVRMLSSPDYSFAEISRITRLTWPTIRAIYEREAQPIEEQRKILARKTARVLRQLVERVEETASTMKPRDAIFGVSVLHDKWALLTGAATSHNVNLNISGEPVDIAAQFAKLHAQIEAKSTGTDTNVIDIPATPALPGE